MIWLTTSTQEITCGECMMSTLLYADDIDLIVPNEADLRNLIDVVQEWCSKWQMGLNLYKTKVIHFRKKQRSNSRSNFSFLFHEQKIAYSSQYKYLDWSAAQEEVCIKPWKAPALLNHKTRIYIYVVVCMLRHTPCYLIN